jgi:hypothetical protein
VPRLGDVGAHFRIESFCHAIVMEDDPETVKLTGVHRNPIRRRAEV